MVDRETGEIVVPFLRTAYNYDTNAASDAAGLKCEDASRTQQQLAEETDINTIVRRFGLTGELPKDVAVPQSGDFTDVVDYQTALNVVIAAREAFASMPADVRKRFGNDAAEFMAFVHDERNRDEARKLGLLVPEVAPPEPLAVRVVPEPPAAT